jgi:hypothetical protein
VGLPDLMVEECLVTAALSAAYRGVSTPQGAVRLTRAHHGSTRSRSQAEWSGGDGRSALRQEPTFSAVRKADVRDKPCPWSASDPQHAFGRSALPLAVSEVRFQSGTQRAKTTHLGPRVHPLSDELAWCGRSKSNQLYGFLSVTRLSNRSIYKNVSWPLESTA